MSRSRRLDELTWALVEDLATGRLDAEGDAIELFERADVLVESTAVAEQAVLALASHASSLLGVLAQVQGRSVDEVVQLLREAREVPDGDR